MYSLIFLNLNSIFLYFLLFSLTSILFNLKKLSSNLHLVQTPYLGDFFYEKEAWTFEPSND